MNSIIEKQIKKKFSPKNKYSSKAIKKTFNTIIFERCCDNFSCTVCPFQNENSSSCLTNIVSSLGYPNKKQRWDMAIEFYKNNYAKEIVHEEMEI